MAFSELTFFQRNVDETLIINDTSVTLIKEIGDTNESEL